MVNKGRQDTFYGIVSRAQGKGDEGNGSGAWSHIARNNSRITFKGPTYSAVMGMVRDELGPDAIILSSRLISAPEGGVEERPWVELHARLPGKTEGAVGETGDKAPARELSIDDSMSLPVQKGSQDERYLKRLRRRLLEQEVRETIVNRLLRRVNKRLPHYGGPRAQGALHLLLDELADCIHLWEPKRTPNTHRFTCLVGRVGVGKTTLLSKLAVSAALKESSKVALIQAGRGRRLDEKLKVSTAVLDCPLRMVETADELGRVLTELSSYNDIYIDVPGINPYDEAGLSSLKELISPAADLEIHLVLNATTRDIDILKTLEVFRDLEVSALSFTRLDEATTYGGLLNAADSARLPFSYFGFGADVPTNFELASKERVIDLLLMLSQNEEDDEDVE